MSHNRIPFTGFFALCASITLLVLLVGGTCAAAGDEGAKIPKLQGSLKELSDSYAVGAKEKVASMVSSGKLFVSDDRVRVMLQIAPGSTLNESDLLPYGVQVERKHRSFWRVLAPIGSLSRLAAEVEEIGYIRTPAKAIPEFVGQGPALTGANTWHTAGYRGNDVKVAVIDQEYSFLTHQSGFTYHTDLSGYTTVNYTTASTSDPIAGTYPGEGFHGTCVAEILMDMAPDADLTLIKIDDDSDLITAKDYCTANGIKVIVMSLGYYNLGDYAGNGPLCDMVNDAYNNGIFFAKSAGNNQQAHYYAPFSDPDANTWHNFSGATENNTIYNFSGTTTNLQVGWGIDLYLCWEWPTSSQDFDLYLYRVGSAVPVATSMNPQTGTEPGTEEIHFTVATAGQHYFKIKRVSGAASPSMNVHIPYYQLTYKTTASSYSQPADAAGAFAVASLQRCNWPGAANVDFYSSFGPTVDGRIKPDITAPTQVDITFLTQGSCSDGFGMTSGAAPHAAGAAALVFSAFPGYTVAQVRSYLENHATDKGPAGKDNEWGAGLLAMGALPSAEALQVTSPNGGETWVVASSHNITWTSSGVSALVDIDYSTNNGASWTPIFANTANDGTEPWTIPNTPSATCLVRITDNDGSPTDVSNATFTISTEEPPECEVPVLSLLGYRTVSYVPPLWEVEVELLNNGPGHADNINAVMDEDIAWLTIPDPNCHYGFLCPGEAGWADWDGYTFDLTNHPGGSFNVWFNVTFTDDCGQQHQVRLDPEFEPANTSGSDAIAVTRLGQNYPNPFNPSTTINFQIAEGGFVHLGIYDVSGKLVRAVVSRNLNRGLYAAHWDGKDNNGVSVASGIYFYKMAAGSFTDTKKMVLLR